MEVCVWAGIPGLLLPVLTALALPTVPDDPTAFKNLPASISVHVPGNVEGTDLFLVIYIDPTGYIAFKSL